ncbi:hypothetical protein KFK09_009540 [Dendrobium nobile]|uniref:Alpha-mannosidase n=1 Tax=Dendrobium nobile TaxID=94219 RepID=A0A8T3BN24_DENNO|nr:hypothetical protein KFK09_009540 [Dendrobium nobile]
MAYHRPSGLLVLLIFFAPAFYYLSEADYIAYNTTAGIVPGKLNVHLVPHSHDDVGWLKTIDQYYVGSNNSIQGACVRNVLDSVVSALLEDKNRKFIYVEQAFFQRWWMQQSNAIKKIVKGLIRSGRLELINGGFCMHDEAASHYIDMIDQTTLGHRFIKQEFGQIPRIGWQIDPFGHSAVQAYLLSAEVGFDALYFSRIDYQDRDERKDLKSLEVVWRGSKTFGSSTDVFTGIFPVNYEPPPGGFYFEVNDDSPVIQDDLLLFDYNVQERVNDFVSAAISQANITRTNHIMFTMGTDFKYQYANSWFKQMDKFIHYVNKDGRVNTFYSTPSIYTDAKYDANEFWPLKTDDFFPYADGPNRYWTGYFSSRPGFKRFVRVLSAYYLAARQLEFLKGRNSSGPTTDSLADALATAQHHDAISGTEQQHVANDYAKRLSIGYAEAEKIVGLSLGCLTESLSSSDCYDPATKFEQCPLLNISYCPPSEAELSQGKSLVVLVYNSLGWKREDVIRIPVVSDSVIIHDSSNGREIECQLLPISDAIMRLRSRYVKAYLGSSPSARPKFWLVFPVSVPPLGFSTYVISSATKRGSITSLSTSYLSKGTSKDNMEIGPGDLKLLYNVEKQELSYYSNKRSSVKSSLGQSYKYYIGAVGDKTDPQVGPMPIEDGNGKELATQFTTRMRTNKIFYTDSNGRDFLKRIRNYRSDWVLQVHQPVAGNYYPINLGIYLQDNRTELSLLVDRSMGGSSIQDGQVELMLHRYILPRLSCKLGLPDSIQGKFYLRIDPLGEGAKWRRTTGQEIYSPLLIAFSEQDGGNWANSHVPKFSATDSYCLPENVAMITLQVGEDKDLSKMATVDLRKLFPVKTISKITETNLSANQEISEMKKKRLKWKVEGNTRSETVVRGKPVDPSELLVELGPMEIRTFLLNFQHVRHQV